MRLNPTETMASRISDFSWYTSKRLSNVPLSSSLYVIDGVHTVSQTCNCHPYNPTQIEGFPNGEGPAPRHPLVLEYVIPEAKALIPSRILNFLENKGISDINTRIYLNVQENQWFGTPILLRPHGLSPWLFDGALNVSALVYAEDDQGNIVLPEQNANVHIHDNVASPNNMALQDIDPLQPKAFYSVVIHNIKAAITRHVLIMERARMDFEDRFLIDPTPEPSIFLELLKSDWESFLASHDIQPE